MNINLLENTGGNIGPFGGGEKNGHALRLKVLHAGDETMQQPGYDQKE
ncbi:hypothetical protein [Methylophaga sp.]|nr:hypothetical protein [Methylophaga sp.]